MLRPIVICLCLVLSLSNLTYTFFKIHSLTAVGSLRVDVRYSSTGYDYFTIIGNTEIYHRVSNGYLFMRSTHGTYI
jgi:hypothetical protein